LWMERILTLRKVFARTGCALNVILLPRSLPHWNRKEEEMNRGIIGVIIGVLVIIILVIVILQLT
jgi:uncharacterized YccA/Bax inhibitor family protein